MIENENIVIKTSGNFDISVNKLAMPPSLNIAKKVVGKAATASVNEVVSCIDVTPKGIPTIVVTMIAIRMPPFTFLTVKITVNKSPIKKTQNCGIFKVAKAGTPLSKVMMPTFKSPI